jgi:hypothetical protein
MMELLDACMDGLYYEWEYGNGPMLLDLVLTDDREAILVEASWWTTPFWGRDDGLKYSQYPVVPEIVAEGQDIRRWHIPERGVSLYPPDSPEQLASAHSVRESVDLQRPDYLDALDLLRVTIPAGLIPALDQWRAKVEARPAITPEDLIKRETAMRKVGVVHVAGPNGTVDAVVFDERGNAATARGTEWIELFVDEWTGLDPRPELERYVLSLGDRRLPTTLSFENPKVTMAEGSVDEIARKAVG